MKDIDKEIKRLQKLKEKDRIKKEKQLLPKYKKEWIGRCFRYRNSYGGDCKGWWLYTKITDVRGINTFRRETFEPNFTVMDIQKTTNNIIMIGTDKSRYTLEGWEEITKDKFKSEMENIILELQRLIFN